jgi:hypothetical protein
MGIENMENEGAYRAVLYTCVLAHWVTLLTAVAVVGTHSINPLALAGEEKAMPLMAAHKESFPLVTAELLP